MSSNYETTSQYNQWQTKSDFNIVNSNSPWWSKSSTTTTRHSQESVTSCLFPPHRWNMHEVTMADQPRTNKFHSLVGHSHPTIQVEANRITSILLQSDRGIRQKKWTKRIQIAVKTDYKEENPLQNFYVELASTLEVANDISNIFVYLFSIHTCV